MMWTMVLALAAAQADSAPPVMVDMVPPAAIEGAPLRQPPEEGFLCAQGYGDCMRLVRGEGDRIDISLFNMDAAAADIAPVTVPGGIGVADTLSDIELWTRVIRVPRASLDAGSDARTYLIGIIGTAMAGYSGGGRSSRRLHLFELTMAGNSASVGPEVVSLPWTSSAMVRACFNEEDNDRRRGACHDEYAYDATLSLDPSGATGARLPQLAYAAQASAYPRTARLDADGDAEAPLTPADLVRWDDPECSYTRTLRFNPATERYEMDRPGPDCSRYTSP